jgi:hypothetical protein
MNFLIVLAILGGLIAACLLYSFSVRTILAVFLYQELGKGYEATEHPEHEEWAPEPMQTRSQIKKVSSDRRREYNRRSYLRNGEKWKPKRQAWKLAHRAELSQQERERRQRKQKEKKENMNMTGKATVKQQLEKYLKSPDFQAGVKSSTIASYGGSGYSVELHPDGSHRNLWNNEIGNKYESPGIILGIPTVDDCNQDEIDDAFVEQEELLAQLMRDNLSDHLVGQDL